MYLNGGCISEFGKNDHRSASPSNNRAQGHARKEKIENDTYLIRYLYVLLLSIANTKTIQNSILKQITFTDFTILNPPPGKSAIFPHTQHFLAEGDLGVRLTSPLVWSLSRPPSEQITYATSASSLDSTSFINTC